MGGGGIFSRSSSLYACYSLVFLGVDEGIGNTNIIKDEKKNMEVVLDPPCQREGAIL